MPWNAGARPVARTASHTPATAKDRALAGLIAYVRRSTLGAHAAARGAGGALSSKPIERPRRAGLSASRHARRLPVTPPPTITTSKSLGATEAAEERDRRICRTEARA
jgi:hypothetical protein